jgi:hypothetical protein
VVDPLAVATHGLQFQQPPDNFVLCVATLGWIYNPLDLVVQPGQPAQPAQPIIGGGGGGVGSPSPVWAPTEAASPAYLARTIAVAIAIAIEGEDNALRVAASIALAAEDDDTEK